jgi:hypothetical protein
MKIRVAILVAALCFSGQATAKGPAKQERGYPLPTYEEVVKTYPEGAPLCETLTDVMGGDDQKLLLEGGYISVSDYGEQQYQCYGTKLTVRKQVTLKGKTYPPGTKLTVDKDLYWIAVGKPPCRGRRPSRPPASPTRRRRRPMGSRRLVTWPRRRSTPPRPPPAWPTSP